MGQMEQEKGGLVTQRVGIACACFGPNLATRTYDQILNTTLLRHEIAPNHSFAASSFTRSLETDPRSLRIMHVYDSIPIYVPL